MVGKYTNNTSERGTFCPELGPHFPHGTFPCGGRVVLFVPVIGQCEAVAYPQLGVGGRSFQNLRRTIVECSKKTFENFFAYNYIKPLTYIKVIC